MRLRLVYLAVLPLVAGQVGCRAAEPGEPASAVLFEEHFDDAALVDRGWYDGERFAISRDRPVAGAGCIEYRWDDGGLTPANGHGARRLHRPTPSVYLRYYLRLSDNWGWSGRSYHPHLTHFLTTENGRWHGPAASRLTLYIEPVGGRLRLGGQDIQNQDAPHGLTQGPLRGGYNGQLFDSAEVVIAPGRWHLIEAEFWLNTVDRAAGTQRADGLVRGWVDGELLIDRDGVVWRSVDFPDMQFNQFLLLPYFGEGLLPHAQTLWIDELLVATERVEPREAD